jgi:hypothetical protein
MAKIKETKEVKVKNNIEADDVETVKDIVITDLEWTDFVLQQLSDDEKIHGNPTTDGLRRIFEKVMNCTVIQSESDLVQAPEPSNDKRASVVHTLTWYDLNVGTDENCKTKTVSGAADVYWGNCDKVYRNHPVAVAETRAEGRALRRALRLRKVVAAEEIAENIEDDIGADNVNKITNNQINFIDVLAKRLDVNVLELVKTLNINETNIKNILHHDALSIIRELSSYQQKIDDIQSNVKGYVNNWSII